MRIMRAGLTALLFSAALTAAAHAQSEQPRVIRGTITAVNGHLVTVQRSEGTIVVNDQPALDQRMTGNVAVGRQIVARGHWQDGTFYATSFADANVYAEAGADAERDEVGDRLHGAVHGTITVVNGHLVTLQRANDTIVVDDQAALNRRLTGNVAVGRDVVAIGYWERGTFFASTIDDARNASAADEAAPDFGAFAHEPDSLSGTITAVNGSQVTLQQSSRSITINDQPALNAKATGVVGVGRQVVADGYWLHGTFYATSFTDATP